MVIGGGSLMGGRFNLLLSVVGALIIQGMNTGILLSGFPPEMNQVVKAVVVLCVLIVQSQRFISLIKGVRNRDKRNLPVTDDHHRRLCVGLYLLSDPVSRFCFHKSDLQYPDR
ncbi:hypothetical protein ACLK1Z_24305 [Escherichia coli]